MRFLSLWVSFIPWEVLRSKSHSFCWVPTCVCLGRGVSFGVDSGLHIGTLPSNWHWHFLGNVDFNHPIQDPYQFFSSVKLLIGIHYSCHCYNKISRQLNFESFGFQFQGTLCWDRKDLVAEAWCWRDLYTEGWPPLDPRLGTDHIHTPISNTKAPFIK